MQKNFVTRHGVALSTLIVTSISVVFSLLITLLIQKIAGMGFNPIGIFISIIAPSILTPPVIIFYGRLLMKISKLENEMRLLATYDQLTGLLSRHAFFDGAYAIFNLAVRKKSPLSVIYADIDHFKKVNDTYGHEVGDYVLSQIAAKISQTKRRSDILGRVGGEEFLLVLPETDKEGALVFAEKLRIAIMETKIQHKESTLSVTISIGISCRSVSKDESLDELIAKADKGLFQSKKDGRNRITLL